MNIETANRLLQYRKKMGLSQEDLAEKIGVSRQAVSKWERAEASPDTDNLIELSKVYGVSLDEMLRGETEEEEAAEKKEQEPNAPDENGADDKNEDNDPSAHVEMNDKGEHVHIGFDGIHIRDKHGTKVDIDRHGVFVNENGEQRVFTDEDGHIHKSAEVIAEEQAERAIKKSKWRLFPYPILTIVAYLMFGFFGVMGGWAYGWIVFLTIPLYYTLVEAILRRKAKIFCYPVLALIVFLILGFTLGLWHPGWIVFLTAPLYYWIVK